MMPRWQRENTAPGGDRRFGSTGVVWHFGQTGYCVRHCGHPTALWPWYGLTPDGQMILADNGHAFDRVAAAKRATEAHWAAAARNRARSPPERPRSDRARS